jgi:hypothetical protein
MFAGVLGAAVAVAAVRGLPLAYRVGLYLVARAGMPFPHMRGSPRQVNSSSL